MPDILTAIFRTAGIFSGAADVVGIYDGTTLQQLFINARPMEAVVRPTSKVMEHPAESGVMIPDHHIINAIEIDLPLMISSDFYSSVYQQITAAFYEGTLLTVQTRVGVFTNMYIVSLPHKESPDIYDAITLALHLKQMLFVTSSTAYAPEEPVDSDTVQNGQQSPTPPVESLQTLSNTTVAGAW